MRWRGLPLDVLLAASGVGLDLLTTAHAGGTEYLPAEMNIPMALLAGLPMGFVRRRPVPVTLYLAGLLVVTDQLVSFTANTAQMLVCVALGVAAYRSGWRAVTVAVAATIAATAVNLVDSGSALTTNGLVYSVLLPVFPVLLGAYLRSSAGRLEERDVTPDALLAAGGVAITVLSTWTSWNQGSQPVWVVGLLAVVGGLSLGVARRLPGLVFLGQGVLLVVTDTYLKDAVTTCVILTLIAIGVFAMRVSSWAWTVVAYLTGCMLTAIAVVGPDTEITAIRVGTLMTLVATPVAIGRYLRMRGAAAAAERLRAEESARLALAQVRADQLAERERIAREVHDIVAHHVGAMVLRAGAARYAAPRGPVADALSDIRDTGHQVLEDLRGLLDVLRDPGARPGLLADPADVMRESAERMAAAGLLVDLRLDPDTGRAPLVARASAARIVQEGLTNVLKHAGPGTEVAVAVTARGKGLAVEIANGRPPAPVERLPSSGSGLAGMRERVRALGGTLTAGSREDGGWLLTATLPGAPGVPGPAASSSGGLSALFGCERTPRDPAGPGHDDAPVEDGGLVDDGGPVSEAGGDLAGGGSIGGAGGSAAGKGAA
ncbi:sensor histidine kinase [Nonomuraea roseoviolacea]|uniref:histidine kinase n=1 Tax=Nonomuraea roseoviolacea subsp. carminata TaxID=160689 RepID=A0ABT1KE58_9ACTN|nr:histidine kinase [Nonomuraea roseoviolacea]MCP2352304.1 signal transduction histidine kinase [Nonomuraea roseoviolacea subsp. carminata]